MPADPRSTADPVPTEPWRSFLRELDELLKGPIELRCLGGFVVTQQSARSTWGVEVAEASHYV